jgi:2-amino-4-hydroxy-6-hydroxymethyldihydropteridine diphosphokinase
VLVVSDNPIWYPPSPNTHHPSPDTQPPLPVYHDRPIDIDILLYDDWIVDEPELRIPHPLMYKRDFVMIPLREILD